MFRIAAFVPSTNSSIISSVAFCFRRFLSNQLSFSRPKLSRDLCRHRSTSISLNSHPVRLFATNSPSIKFVVQPDAQMKEQIRAFQAEQQKKLTKGDGLNPDEWTLIFLNRKADSVLWYMWPLIIVATIMSGLLTIFIFLQLFSRFYTKQLSGEDLGYLGGCGILGIIIIFLLTRLRRLTVFRMYQRKSNSAKVDGNPKREYCIIWYNFWKRRRQFFYNHTETSGANERKSRLVSPSFYARNRPWEVTGNDFFISDDYFYARTPIDADVRKEGPKK